MINSFEIHLDKDGTKIKFLDIPKNYTDDIEVLLNECFRDWYSYTNISKIRGKG